VAKEATTGAIDGDNSQPLSLAQLSLLALCLGVVTGLGAVIFRDLIGFIHNLLFTGHAVIRYDANLFTPPSPWGPLVILVPVLGALVVTFLVNNFAPEAKGHLVPEVMDAIYYKGASSVRSLRWSNHSHRPSRSEAAHPLDAKDRSSRLAPLLDQLWGKSSAYRRGSGSLSLPQEPARASPPPSIRRSAGSCSPSS